MEKFFANIPQDKLLHFFYGSIISFLLGLFLPQLYVIAIVCIIAVSKELYDLYIKGTKIDLLDILFTIIPSLI